MSRRRADPTRPTLEVPLTECSLCGRKRAEMTSVEKVGPDKAKRNFHCHAWIQGDSAHVLYTKTPHASVTTGSVMSGGACSPAASNLANAVLTDSTLRYDVAASKPWTVGVGS